MAVVTIRDLEPYSGWRKRLLPAHFDRKMFHVDTGSRESGRRIVTHEFPKKDLPYSEDMGRRAIEFSVRGYIIQFVMDTDSILYQRDYTIPRNALQERLDQGGYGTLQLPMMRPLRVVCSRYRMMEETRTGGYCTFDMTFVELGTKPFQPLPLGMENLIAESEKLKKEVRDVLDHLVWGSSPGK